MQCSGLWKDDLEDPGELRVPEELADLYEASIRGVLVRGPRRGQRVVRFFGEAARRTHDGALPRSSGDAFNLHARLATHAGDRAAVERLSRYILRPPLAQARIERRADRRIALTLKRPWRDGTAGVLAEPLELLARLAALIPRPRTNIIRFHGIYAPRARLRYPARTSEELYNTSPFCLSTPLRWAHRPGSSGRNPLLILPTRGVRSLNYPF